MYAEHLLTLWNILSKHRFKFSKSLSVSVLSNIELFAQAWPRISKDGLAIPKVDASCAAKMAGQVNSVVIMEAERVNDF